MQIKFKRDTAFRKQFFVPDSFAHPAKMDAQLTIWITERYTEVGETILDPMAGSGTQMLACTLGRNVILLELERKFIIMMEGGDCNGFDCALCNQRMEWKAIETEEEFLLLADKQFPNNKQLEIAFTRYGWEWTQKRILHRYPQGEHHIVGNWEQVKQRPQFEGLGGVLGNCQILQGDARNLEGVMADKIITSLPYAGSEQFLDKEWINKEQPRPHRPQADKIITSPPYAENTHHSDDALDLQDFTPGRTGRVGGTAGNSEGQIGQLPYGNIDKIITSPPYENQIHKGSAQPGPGGNVIVGDDYVKSRGNIGNLKSDSYLEAMAQVYSQCFSVLKDGGLMILVTKNFIRNRQVVRLDSDTIKLCEQVGFSFVERWYRKLPAQSFWRTIYQQKYPDVETIEFEDVLVFSKASAL